MAIEDLTTWSLLDPNGRFTVTAARSTWTGLLRNESAYRYKAKSFNGDFIHLFDFEVGAASGEGGVSVSYGLSDVLEDYSAIFDNSDYELAVYGGTFAGTFFLQVDEAHNGVQYIDFYVGASEGVTYYGELERDESIGSFGQIILRVFSDIARTILVDTMTVLLHEKVNLQYAYAGQSFNSGTTQTHTGFTENVDFQGVAGGVGPLINGGLISNGLIGGRLV